MATFPLDAELDGGEDRAYELAKNSFVTLFGRRAVLDDLLGWLRVKGYYVVEVDCLPASDLRELTDAVAQALSFPDYYGHNLSAFNDCLHDVASYDYGTHENATGTVLVLNRFDAFASTDSSGAHAILDIFAAQARWAALIGHRMLCLVQSNDPHLTIGPVGASPVTWSNQEWLDPNPRT